MRTQSGRTTAFPPPLSTAGFPTGAQEQHITGRMSRLMRQAMAGINLFFIFSVLGFFQKNFYNSEDSERGVPYRERQSAPRSFGTCSEQK